MLIGEHPRLYFIWLCGFSKKKKSNLIIAKILPLIWLILVKSNVLSITDIVLHPFVFVELVFSIQFVHNLSVINYS